MRGGPGASPGKVMIFIPLKMRSCVTAFMFLLYPICALDSQVSAVHRMIRSHVVLQYILLASKKFVTMKTFSCVLM